MFPVFVVFFALMPYLGLRTAGTFSMFSNLRTEGDISNHLLLAANPLKMWYQEDVVEILALGPEHVSPGQEPLTGYLMPVVEFKKRINDWREEGLDGLHARYTYDGRILETDDLVTDSPWDVQGNDAEMFLLDFRVVQASTAPNRCRW